MQIAEILLGLLSIVVLELAEKSGSQPKKSKVIRYFSEQIGVLRQLVGGRVVRFCG